MERRNQVGRGCRAAWGTLHPSLLLYPISPPFSSPSPWPPVPPEPTAVWSWEDQDWATRHRLSSPPNYAVTAWAATLFIPVFQDRCAARPFLPPGREPGTWRSCVPPFKVTGPALPCSKQLTAYGTLGGRLGSGQRQMGGSVMSLGAREAHQDPRGV